MSQRRFVRGVRVDRSGLAQFTVLIRSPEDPERSERSPEKDKTPHQRLRKMAVEQLEEAILALLSDRVPRTFNRMMVELLDHTADMCHNQPPEQALWRLAEAGKIEHTMRAPILFRISKEAR